ncbi:uncharacterized protein V6R79_014563 [Siganus canaliculatus]
MQECVKQLEVDNSRLVTEVKRVHERVLQAQDDSDQAQRELDHIKTRLESCQPHLKGGEGDEPWKQVSRARHTKVETDSTPQRDAIANQPEPGAESPHRPETPSPYASDFLTMDSYGAPPTVRRLDPVSPARGQNRPYGQTGLTNLAFSLSKELVPTKPSFHQPRVDPLRDQQPRSFLDRGPRSLRPINPYSESKDSDEAFLLQDEGLRTRQLESLARDIERFDPSSKETNVYDYLREVDRCLLDIPHPSCREKLKLVWQTTTRSVHAFIETLPPAIRDRYSALCRALREEYSTYSNLASAIQGALGIQQKRSESPKEYFRRLRAAYFQGHNAPGLEEEPAFKALFLNNLHSDIQWDPYGPRWEPQAHSYQEPSQILSQVENYESFLCRLNNEGSTLYCPQLVGGVQLNGIVAHNTGLALWSEKSAIRSMKTCSALGSLLCLSHIAIEFFPRISHGPP